MEPDSSVSTEPVGPVEDWPNTPPVEKEPKEPMPEPEVPDPNNPPPFVDPAEFESFDDVDSEEVELPEDSFDEGAVKDEEVLD